MRFKPSYLIVLESESAGLACLRSTVSRSVKRRITQFPLLRCRPARFARWHGESCGQLCPLKFAGWDGKSYR
jgi:hypothetical protein